MSRNKHTDQASDLLADILEGTRETAQEEEARLLADRQRREAAEAAERRAAEANRRAEAERMLAAEAARRQNAERKRASLVRAIEGPSEEELAAVAKAEAEAAARIDMERKLAEAERARVEAERMAAQATQQARVREEQRLAAIAQTPPPARRNNTGLLVAVSAMGMAATLLLLGMGGLYAYQSQNEIPVQTYAKATYTPQSVTSDAAPAFGFVPEAVEVPEETTKPKARPWKRGNNGNRGATRPTKPTKPNADRFVLPPEDGGDVFGSGKE